MEPVISKNDIVFSQPITNPKNISIGDYVIYQTEELAPEYVCHQVISKYTETVELQGINESESEIVPYENIQSNVFQIGSYPVKINARYVYFPSHTS
jgi:alpha-D-ribose 1-methylphosphonate 5-phosphate C-P lyase